MRQSANYTERPMLTFELRQLMHAMFRRVLSRPGEGGAAIGASAANGIGVMRGL